MWQFGMLTRKFNRMMFNGWLFKRPLFGSNIRNRTNMFPPYTPYRPLFHVMWLPSTTTTAADHTMHPASPRAVCLTV